MGLPSDTALGPVHLTVADLDRSIAYYEQAIGLVVRERDADRVTLTAGGVDLLVLAEEPGARPSLGYSGLFHFALLVPERADLARWLAHAARRRVTLAGMSDHYVSEAIYLSDPDEHGIEIYWDRPRSVWQGKVAERLTTQRLDTGGLLSELRDPEIEPFAGLPAGTLVGHVHLRVADVPQSVAFYRDVLGLDLMAQLGPQAAFLGAGGYHHHIGANTWESRGASQPPAGTARLERATIVLPTEASRDQAVARVSSAGHPTEQADDGVLVRDPSGNPLVLSVARAG